MDVTSVKRIRQSDWTDSGVRFLRARDIVAESKNEEVSEPLFISQEKYDEYSAVSGKVEKGDLLVTGVGTIGVPMLINSEEPLYFKDGNIIWFKNKNAIDGRFFYHLFNGLNVQKFIKESAGTGTVGTYTIENGKKTPINLPLRKEEQEKIGEYFSNLDHLITLHQCKCYLLFKLLHNDWEQRKLDDWGDFYYGRSCPKWSVTENATIPCIRYGELYTKFGAKIDRVYSYTNMPPENLRFSKGTEVLIPRVGEDPMDYNHCTWLSMPDIAIGEMISVFNTDNNPLFTATMFNATLQNDFAMRVEGGSVTNLYFEKLKNIEVSFPSILEQEKIAAYFEDLDHLITLHHALYCKDASKKVRAAKAVLAKQGKYIAAFAPFGYQKSEDDKHMLVPNPVTAPVVRLIFELATKGMKYTEIANYLNDNGYDSIFEHYQKLGVRRCYERDIGQHMWSPSTVMGILYNEVYIGSVINNKTADNIDTGHQVVQRDKEDWIIVENCHEPLVSVEDFKLAHKMIARREKSPRKPNGKWRKSYLRCGVCGKGLNKYGNGSSYRCREGHVSRIRGEEIEQAVLDVARKMAVVRLEEFEIQMNKDSSSDDIGQEIESLKKAKAHYAKLKFEIYDDYTRTNITREQMAKKTAEVKNKIAELDKMIAEKQELFDLQKDLFVDAKQEQLTKLSKLDKFDEDVIRNIIDYVLIYDNEHIEIKWNFDDFHIE